MELVVATGEGGVLFTCTCGARVSGDSTDRLIQHGGSRAGGGAAARAEKYSTYIRNAPHSRTVQYIDEYCPECGLELGLLRLGEEEAVVRVCKCGWKSHTQKSAAADV